ncbi:dual specificity calcium/calmodulin-dependent 3',5'-cyclic nucleotide phosphodiesterase 1C-like isoform X3 [Adelges cooleyi]|uniref:dual specificity calcium/calmodulin-dependent 3',5'-cyclic nucleotide phosphodiesterase 1C-like isoform X3 n=1 Tax=Adelges cooleyi TaxID=133065 RepID=UPI0021802B4E|nr:dual specificity calcium/calmodulin-dependent 3',5'-cyclic nucleotide phosphodiesterase 1C-like isoform X3 [Adelges cooleyi]
MDQQQHSNKPDDTVQTGDGGPSQPSTSADNGQDAPQRPSTSADNGQDVSQQPSTSADNGQDVSQRPSTSADNGQDLPQQPPLNADDGQAENVPRIVQMVDRGVQVNVLILSNAFQKKCILTVDGYSYVISISDLSLLSLITTGRSHPNENPVDGVIECGEMEELIESKGAQDPDNNDDDRRAQALTSAHPGALTIVRRSSHKKNNYLEDYDFALSNEAENMLDDVDLSTDSLPSVDTTDAIDKAALRLRCLMGRLRKGQVPAEVLHKNLFFAAKVLEATFGDDDTKDDADDYQDIQNDPQPSTSTGVTGISSRRIRPAIWTRRLAAEEDDELSEVQPDKVPQEVRDWLASTFTRQMATPRRRGEDKPKFKSVAHAIRAGIFVDRIYRRMTTTPLMQFPDNVTESLKNVNDWSFDVYELSSYANGQPLKYLGYDLLNRYGIFQKFKVPTVVMENFLAKIEEGYSRHKNPYHNNLHGADVAQTVHYMLFQTGLMNWLTDLEIFAMLIAAITHDYEHTGTTNNFHVMSGSDIALLYNDRAVLENHHISCTFKLLRDDDCNILVNLTKEEYREFRSLMIDMVLATDMSFHFQQLKTMKTLISSPEPTIDKSKAMSMVLHCADIAHPAKEWKLHYKWTCQLLEEFFLQGDLENKLGLPYSPLCDRNNTLIAESQIGFIEFIVEPSMSLCSDMLEVILGPINVVSNPVTDETSVVDKKADDNERSESDVSIACNAMSNNLEEVGTSGSKDANEDDTKSGDKKANGNAEVKLFKIEKPWRDCLEFNKKKWMAQAIKEQKLRLSKTTYTMSDIQVLSTESTPVISTVSSTVTSPVSTPDNPKPFPDKNDE